MNLPITSIVWGSIQVTFLCIASLGFAWTLRGRRPQLTTAVLSGACMAAIGLAIIAWLPSSQWSFVKAIPQLSEVDQMPMDLIDPTNSPSIASDASNSLYQGSNQLRELDSRELGLSASDSEFSLATRIQDWIRARVQSIDTKVRSTEDSERTQATVAMIRLKGFLLVGLAMMFGLWLYGWAYMRWIVRESQVLHDADVQAMVARLSKQLHLSHIPQIRTSNHVPIGAMVGFFRPSLILRSNWSHWSREELQAVLCHELAHAVRRDFLWVVVGSWVRILFFFHPMMHMLVRRLRMEQELAADQLAAGLMNNAHAYGRALASLALRSQQFSRAPSPMLSAEQICVVRRIKMLKQGRLVPRTNRWKWAGCATLATTLAMVPLSGLRGTPPETKEETSVSAETASSKEASLTEEEQKAREAIRVAMEQRKEVMAKYPPLNLEGLMVWHPGRIQSSKIQPEIRWSHLAMTSLVLGQFPEDAEIHGQTKWSLQWEDINREHGRFLTGCDIYHADQVTPNLLTQFLTSPMMGPLRESGERKVIEGEAVVGIGNERYDSLKPIPVTSEVWLLDNAKGFFRGTEEQVSEYIRGQFDPFAKIPEAFREQYKASAVAAVFGNCREWESKGDAHFLGCKEEEQWGMVSPVLIGLEHLGLFVPTDGGSVCDVRAVYHDEAAALAATEACTALFGTARSWLAHEGSKDPESAIWQEILRNVDCTAVGKEIRVTFAIPQIPDANEVQPGWNNLGFNTTDALESNSLSVQGQMPNSLLAQSIRADAYRGKRVRLRTEIACHEDAVHRAGLFGWTSGENERTIALQSQSIDGKQSMDSTFSLQPPKPLVDTRTQWQTVSMEFNVSPDSQVLSFGCYAQFANIQVRRVQLEVVGAEDRTIEPSKHHLPFNICVVPGAPLRDAPFNLNFSMPKPKPQKPDAEKSGEQKPDAKVAEQKSKTTVK